MRTETFEIQGGLPDLNKIIELSKKGNRNYQPYSIMKKEETEKVAWCCKGMKPCCPTSWRN